MSNNWDSCTERASWSRALEVPHWASLAFTLCHWLLRTLQEGGYRAGGQGLTKGMEEASIYQRVQKAADPSGLSGQAPSSNQQMPEELSE